MGHSSVSQLFSIRIAEDYTATPGPRNQGEGDYSGEHFLGTLLEPRFLEARAKGEMLLIDLDGAEGYATSFLEAAFGGLSRKYGFMDVLKVLQFKSEEEPYLKDEIEEYIRDANA